MMGPELNGADVVVSKTSSLVVPGPSTCDAGVLCMNDNCVDLNYSMGFLYPIGVPRSLGDHV
jgi:hypothetical protein